MRERGRLNTCLVRGWLLVGQHPHLFPETGTQTVLLCFEIMPGLDIQPEALEVPKYRARRNAVSAVTARLPRTISLIRRGGTPTSLASWYWLTSSGFRKSSRRTSPGVVGGSFFLAINCS